VPIVRFRESSELNENGAFDEFPKGNAKLEHESRAVMHIVVVPHCFVVFAMQAKLNISRQLF
jgi:hypothetical protein